MRSGSVSTSFKECQKTLLRLRKEVGDLETEDVAVAVDLRDMELRTQLEDLGTTLAALLKAVGPGADMDMWKRKIQNAQNDQRALLSSLNEVCKRREQVREEEEAKKALMDRRYNLDHVKLDNEYKINSSAANSISMVSQYIEMGKATVSEFRRQRAMLENVQSRLVDAGYSMGLSSSLMAVIQRRDFVDRMIVFGGMVVVVMVVAFIWWIRK